MEMIVIGLNMIVAAVTAKHWRHSMLRAG